MASDSPSATTPRTIGTRSHLCRRRTDAIGRLTSAIAPSGLRTATDHADGPRIITPSRTAWPPMGWLTASLCGPAGLLQTALEALHPPTGVEQLLLSGVERMAFRANLDVQLGLRRARLELGAARAANRGENV